ncbi:hypothetical protein Taro_028750, partial [Colocasia esculenta]|nr:hypothetical protein [Colocasia esculenta]
FQSEPVNLYFLVNGLIEQVLTQPQELTKEGFILQAAIEAAANAVTSLKDSLNEWDSKVGDGDCGSTMFRGATAIMEDMKKWYVAVSPFSKQENLMHSKLIANSIVCIAIPISPSMMPLKQSMRLVLQFEGYDIFCKAAYAKLKGSPAGPTSKQWADALEASIAAVSKYGGASAGYRTMLDALIPASTVLKEAGRSSYVSGDVVMTVPDPGAMAAAAWYRAAALAIKNKYSSPS